MTGATNEFLQPIGDALPDWQPRAYPDRVTLQGRYCRLEPLNPANHTKSLWKAWSKAQDGRDWTYTFAGPFANEQQYADYIVTAAASNDPLHFTVIDQRSGHALGTLSLMRIDPANGTIEVGSVTFSPELKNTVQGTEAHFLLMKYAFDALGYRRYEWKCDSLNGPSRRAALRLGFRFEGLFRQVVVYKGRNRDTAWFSITSVEWPLVKSAFEAWLADDNIRGGKQVQSLAALRDGLAANNTRPGKTAVDVRPLAEGDYAAWYELWQAYLTFYDTKLTDEVTLFNWRRMLSPTEPMYALGAFDEQQRLLGIVHMVYHRGTWAKRDHCYLEDLFTVPASRGKGVGRSLIEAVYRHAQENNASRVYWHTHETNATAQTLYDKVADKPGFIQYRKELE
ncbi:GNAT family N-acetyltransferase [Dryocola sp. BD626]|uniref:GNAT family N-acetyltransferase n=1 Tax=Dryocola sp. BD626 TaxID=3133273 RepID=UPI003F4FE991